jgi:hypothetical protein
MEGGTMRHRVEVDQSIKIEDTGATVLAFANGLNFAIQIPAKVKLAGLKMLRDQARKPGVAHRKAEAVRRGKDHNYRRITEAELTQLLE